MSILARTARALRLAKLLSKAIAPLPDLPTWSSVESQAQRLASGRSAAYNLSTLDLGCGETPRNPFGATNLHGVDIREDLSRNVRFADVTVDPIPWPDATFDFVTAFDFIEHVPRVIYLPARRFPFVVLMNEIWRTLKPSGIFLSKTPVYPFSSVFRDPTHVNIITCETFPLYFDDKSRLAAMYGFTGAFEVVDQGLVDGSLVSFLRKV